MSPEHTDHKLDAGSSTRHGPSSWPLSVGGAGDGDAVSLRSTQKKKKKEKKKKQKSPPAAGRAGFR